MECKKDVPNKFSRILYEERMHIEKHIASWLPPKTLFNSFISKNVEDSIQYREKGNNFFKLKLHDGEIHFQAWKFYSLSIAFAPINSKELSLGYGNRSALLLHLEKYEECIKDCDRAIDITSCKFLKCKLMCRKAECLDILNKNLTQQVCQEAMNNLSELTLSSDLKDKFIDKIQNILKRVQTPQLMEQICIEKTDLYDFQRQKEVPCASAAVEIKYNNHWGRHIVASRDIRPGEIIGIEKVYFTCINGDGRYLYCSYCIQPAWSSISCDQCTYDFYCSDKCKSDAWIKYHKFECSIYPFLLNYSQFLQIVRLLFITVYDAGSIEDLKKHLLNIETCKDERKKGFSSEGIFDINKPESLYSLYSKKKNQ